MVMWVFGYGSLVWNPGFHYDEKVLGFIKGYKRVFDLACIDHRGTPEHPARTCTLEKAEEAICWGTAFCVRGGPEKERLAMEYLERRECEYDLKTSVDFYKEDDPLLLLLQFTVSIFTILRFSLLLGHPARFLFRQIHGRTLAIRSFHEISARGLPALNKASLKKLPIKGSTFLLGQSLLMVSAHPQLAAAAEIIKPEPIYEVGELFELSIQLSYLLLLLGLLGVGTFYVIRQVLVRRELDLSAKELQEQVRSGDASATELFELGAVMLRRKFYPAANKFLQQAIQKWDGDDQDLAQVYNALGVSYVREDKLDKGIAQFEMAVKLQPGYVTAWNNLGDAYEKKKELPLALNAFEEVLLFDPNNKVARPRRDALKDRVKLYKGVVAVKSKKR